jgi:hypothetical protein
VRAPPAPLTAKVLHAPAGQVAVVVAGLVIVISGLVLAVRGAQRHFEDNLRMDKLGTITRRVVVAAGIACFGLFSLVEARYFKT